MRGDVRADLQENEGRVNRRFNSAHVPFPASIQCPVSRDGPIHSNIALIWSIVAPIYSMNEPFCRIIALIYSIVGPIYSIIAANQSMFAPNQSKMLRFGAFWNFGRPLLCQNGKLKEHDACQRQHRPCSIGKSQPHKVPPASG